MTERPFYLRTGVESAYVSFHSADPAAGRDTAVILCPPFGWEEVCAYRCVREWALMLADAGYPALRLSLPSTGDSSGSPRDPDRLAAWTAAIDDAAAWLRSETGRGRIVAIGMSLGGLLAYRAAALGGEVDDLVLWGAPARGRALIRQLRAFAKLEASQFFAGLTPPPPLPEGELEAGGFVLSAQTTQELGQLDLAGLALPNAPRRRVLLLERDGIAVDARLQEHLQELGAKVSVAPGDGYADMTSHPQQAQPATTTFARVQEWLDAAPAHAADDAAAPPAPPPAAAAADFGGDGGPAWTETPVTVEVSGARLTGILVAPAQRPGHGLCALLLNAGAVRRIGPSRMWVQTARRWAGQGVPVLRLDVEGIGDAGGAVTPYASDGALYADNLIPQVLGAMNELEDRGVGDSFLLAGLCAGAYWSLHLALQDPRVRAAVMLNSRALVWDTGLAPSRYMRTLITERPSLSRIREVATWSLVLEVARWLAGAPGRWLRRLTSAQARAQATGSEVDDLLERLHRSGTPATFLFSENEPLQEELSSSGRLATLAGWPNVTLEHVAVIDHTLRPSWAQARAQEAMDRALHRELARIGASAGPELSAPGAGR